MLNQNARLNQLQAWVVSLKIIQLFINFHTCRRDKKQIKQESLMLSFPFHHIPAPNLLLYMKLHFNIHHGQPDTNLHDILSFLQDVSKSVASDQRDLHSTVRAFKRSQKMRHAAPGTNKNMTMYHTSDTQWIYMSEQPDLLESLSTAQRSKEHFSGEANLSTHSGQGGTRPRKGSCLVLRNWNDGQILALLHQHLAVKNFKSIVSA